MTLAALRSDATVKKTLTLSGPKAWTVPEVIELCEKLADERAQVTQVRIRELRCDAFCNTLVESWDMAGVR